MSRVLITGFEPFDGLSHNPSQAVLAKLPDQIGDGHITTAVLPVDTESIEATLQGLFQDTFDMVLMTGLAKDRPTLTVEQYAFNHRAFEHPDNKGHVVKNGAVTPSGPARIGVRLNAQAIVDAWQSDGFPAETSESPGRFLCNQTLYLALHLLPKTTQVGFIHLPPDEHLAGDHAPLSLDRQAIALTMAIRVSLLAAHA